jgi:hypothetical protein
MANVYTNPILRTECIGNSLNTINTNFTSLDEGIVATNNSLTSQINTLQTNLSLSATNLSNRINSTLSPLAIVSFRCFFNTAGVSNSTNNSSVTPINTAAYRQILRSFNVPFVVRESATLYTVYFTNPVTTPYTTIITQRDGSFNAATTNYIPYTRNPTSTKFEIFNGTGDTYTASPGFDIVVF